MAHYDVVVVGAGHNGLTCACYKVPGLPGLYLTGASTHPGGGVFAASGYNTARVILGER